MSDQLPSGATPLSRSTGGYAPSTALIMRPSGAAANLPPVTSLNFPGDQLQAAIARCVALQLVELTLRPQARLPLSLHLCYYQTCLLLKHIFISSDPPPDDRSTGGTDGGAAWLAQGRILRRTGGSPCRRMLRITPSCDAARCRFTGLAAPYGGSSSARDRKSQAAS